MTQRNRVRRRRSRKMTRRSEVPQEALSEDESFDAESQERSNITRLENEARQNAHRRREKINDTVTVIARWLMVLFAILGAFIAVSWTVKQFTPWGWISDDQLQYIRTVFNGGFIVSILYFVRDYMRRE